jgi:thiamine biosynthesis protein ThiS
MMDETHKTSVTKDITVTANGQTYAFPIGSTVATLLTSLEVKAEYVVVQMDGDIIPRSDYASTILQPGCKLEVVTMVGGG